MKTKISILLLMVAFAFSATAQSIANYIDVVYLKNGSMIKGVIVEQVPGKTIKLKTADGSEFVYLIDDVEKFTREEVKTENSSDKFCASKKWFNGEFKQKEKGMYAEFDMLGNSAAFALRMTHGYKFNQRASIGVALGAENVALKSGERLPELSLNLVLSGDLLNRKITPFYQIEGGYGFSLDRYGYNSDLLNGNRFGFPKGPRMGGSIDDSPTVDDGLYAGQYSTLNYGGPQSGLVLGVKIQTKKKLYFKLGLDARLTSNFSDSHYSIFNQAGQVTGIEKTQSFDVKPGIGARLSFGF